MEIRIVQRPIGEAPEWVRDAWIGLSIPVADKRLLTWRGFGVISGSVNLPRQLWAMLLGRSLKIEGYVVDAKQAVDLLAVRNAAAAQWWRENAPALLMRKRRFVFDRDACLVI
jgi:hypothetical protein